ncbi:MAG: TadE/TadG family type IV pilus assembly protein [Pseudomonadota bacterium]
MTFLTQPKRARSICRNRDGNVAMIFALSIIPIFAVAGLAIDFQNTTSRKVKVQAAIDASVIAGARSMQAGASEDEIRVEMNSYIENMISVEGSSLSCDEADIIFPQGTQDVQVDIKCYQKTTLSAVIGQDEIEFDVSSTSTWGIAKLDIAFMFDVSGSMNDDNRLADLKTSTLEAIDILLPEDALPEVIEYTRVAMSTYNTMVDAGSFFEDVTGVSKTRTYTHDVMVEYDDHDEGNSNNHFSVELWDTKNDEFIMEFGDGATIYLSEDDLEDLGMVVDVKQWGSYDDDDVESMLLDLDGPVNAYRLENIAPYAVFGDWYGNLYNNDMEHGEYEFTYRVYKKNNAKNQIFKRDIEFEIVLNEQAETKSKTITSSCVWERDGDEAFTAAKPDDGSYLAHKTAWFVEDNSSSGGYWETGTPERDEWYYSGDECRAFAPVELTNNRTTLINYVNSLSADGGTAGHQGVAWSWYLIAPEWTDLFSQSAAPMAYDEPDSIKAVILMTDGEFNSEIFGDQGTSAEQAKALCDSMKLKDVVVYSVALQAPPEGQAVLEYCSSGPEYYHLAQNGQELIDAYRGIATSLSDLRIKF